MRTSTLAQILGSVLFGNAQSVDLGTASTFGALAPAGVTNTGATEITGDVGTTGSSITGFPPGVITGSFHIDDSVAVAAQNDSAAAYLQGQALTPTVDEAGLTTLGGLTLGPGIYNFDLAVTLAGILTLSGDGDYVFQLATTLTTASLSTVLLTNGASACNVFWIVGTGATLGTGSVFAGNILAGTAITVTTGVSVSGGLYGGSAVTLDTNVIEACDGTDTSPTSSTSLVLSTSSSIVSSTAISTSVPVTTTTTTTSVSVSTTSKTTTTPKTSTTSKKTSTISTKAPTSTPKNPCPENPLLDPIGYELCILTNGHL